MADNMTFDDFFDGLFAPIPEAPKAEKKAEPKKAATVSKKDSKATKKPAPKAPEYSVPLKIHIGYAPVFTLGADVFGGKEKGITEAEVIETLGKTYPYFQKAATKVARISDTEIRAWLDEGKAQGKGTVKLTAGTRSYLGMTYIPTGEFLEGKDENEVDITKLEKSIVKVIDSRIVTDGKIVSVIPGSRVVLDYETLHLPLTVEVLMGKRNQEILTMGDFSTSKAEDADAESEESSEDEAEEVTEVSTEDATKAVGGDTVTAKQVVAKLVEKYPSFDGGMKLCECREEGKVVGYTIRYEPTVAKTASAPKETTYDVSNGLTISLLFKRYETTAADFNGKTEVTVKDIAGYLRAQGELDYRDDKTSISDYNKEEKIVVVAFRGGTKG